MAEDQMSSLVPSADSYAAMVNSVNAQEARIHGARAGEVMGLDRR